MLLIKCRDCDELTGNNTERCNPCKSKWRKNMDEARSTTKDESQLCKECGKTVLFSTMVPSVCNTCLSKKDEADVINWPKHYNTSKIQPIDVIDAWELGFKLGNAVKYIARAGKKNPDKIEEDLKKAIWYIQHHIDTLNGDK